MRECIAPDCFLSLAYFSGYLILHNFNSTSFSAALCQHFHCKPHFNVNTVHLQEGAFYTEKWHIHDQIQAQLNSKEH